MALWCQRSRTASAQVEAVRFCLELAFFRVGAGVLTEEFGWEVGIRVAPHVATLASHSRESDLDKEADLTGRDSASLN